MQDLLVQVSQREEPAHRYPQHTLDVGQMQLHQLQHHDQVLLQQQLEHLHQQHRQRQRHKQQQQQDQLQQLDEDQQQQAMRHNREALELLSPAHTGPLTGTLQHAISEPVNGQDLLQHEWHDSSRALAADQHVAEQTAAAVSQASHLVGAAVVEASEHSTSSTPGGNSSCAAASASGNSRSNSSFTQVGTAAQLAVGAMPAAMLAHVHEESSGPSATQR